MKASLNCIIFILACDCDARRQKGDHGCYSLLKEFWS